MARDAIFSLSQAFWIAVQPLSLAFLLTALAVLLALAGWRRLAAASALLSAAILFVTLFTSAGTVALQFLEERFPRPAAEPDHLSCMIVLGGAAENEVNSSRNGFELNQTADRFVEALRLARNHPGARILISGGDGSFSGGLEGDAVMARRFFPAFGIAPERLIVEDTSRNTYENSLASAQMLSSLGLHDCLLITSAFHMPRSLGLFRGAGIAVRPWPVDYRTSGRAGLGLDFSQPSKNAQLATTAAREWTSLWAQYLTGRTESLLPR